MLLACATALPAAAADGRYSGQVTDALRKPTHRLAAGAGGRAAADLVFVDARGAHTTVRACVRRTDVAGVHRCFAVVTGPKDVPVVTPLRFRRGSWSVRWSVGGQPVARWRFDVV